MINFRYKIFINNNIYILPKISMAKNSIADIISIFMIVLNHLVIFLTFFLILAYPVLLCPLVGLIQTALNQ